MKICAISYSIYHPFTNSYPMTNYENLKDLFQFVKMKNGSRKHWFDTIGWGMKEAMHVMLMEAIKAIVPKTTFYDANFIVTNVDEVMTISNTQWLSIQFYMVKSGKMINVKWVS